MPKSFILSKISFVFKSREAGDSADEPLAADIKKRAALYLETVRQAGAEFAGGRISSGTLEELSEPLLTQDVFEATANKFWEN